MVSESGETKTVFGCPELYFAIVTTSRDVCPIGGVTNNVQVKEVALLFEDVSLALPFPDEKLPLILAAKGNPVTRRVYGNAVNLALRNLERMD